MASTKIALEHAPAESRGTCAQTEAVAGLGNVCSTNTGLFRVKLDSGASLTTHGFDGPQPDAFNSYMTGSSQALSTASVSNIDCVDAATTKHTTLIYAYPPGQASRYGTIAPLLRQEAYRMSAFLDAESRSVDPQKGIKIPLECDGGGTPVVLQLQTTTATGSDSFQSIVNDLNDQGYGNSYSLLAKDRYVVFYDASIGNGVAGTGNLWSDDRAQTSSANNNGGMFAVEFNWGNVPHWDVLLHEAGHNMGAVQSSAANTSGAGHCTDGQDIMCYSDGGPNAYRSNVCAVEVFDCNRNDYFNPSPAAGSYLATHWNTAATYNQYLEHINLNDSVAPSVPGNVAQGNASNTASSLLWTAATDNVAVAGYHLWQSDGESGWTLTGSVPANQSYYTFGNLESDSSYDVAISAYDGSGNQSAKVAYTITTNSTPDVSPPTAASSLAAASVTMNSVKLMWAPASDDVGVTGYTIYEDNGGGNTHALAAVATNSGLVSGLLPGRSYHLGVTAHDDAGHQSAPVWITAMTTSDTIAPTVPRAPRVGTRTRRSVTIKWTGATDNVGVAHYYIYRWTGSSWRLAKSTNGSARKVSITGLRRGRRYFFVLRSADARGNLSGWGTPFGATTKR